MIPMGKAESHHENFPTMKSISLCPSRIGFILLVSLSLTLAGCGDGKKRIESSGNLKQLSAAIIAYHDSKRAWPNSLEQLKPLIGTRGLIGVIGNGKDFATLIQNSLTGDNPGYDYVKLNGSDTSGVVLYQLKGGVRDTSLPAAYADGSVH